jgi:hypothetical protein
MFWSSNSSSRFYAIAHLANKRKTTVQSAVLPPIPLLSYLFPVRTSRSFSLCGLIAYINAVMNKHLSIHNLQLPLGSSFNNLKQSKLDPSLEPAPLTISEFLKFFTH